MGWALPSTFVQDYPEDGRDTDTEITKAQSPNKRDEAAVERYRLTEHPAQETCTLRAGQPDCPVSFGVLCQMMGVSQDTHKYALARYVDADHGASNQSGNRNGV